ncbi:MULTISPECIES: T9SS type A sorting domain-containing protein [Flavobacterium]|uniref:T9SS type A sorting domain-containing protein n=1 Tax=Flavobacterium jumunjinense TaxID=998845 RepID=A0ABV5GMF4_9FLAO|nr:MULTISPECIES: T9SS type A sorting domain-containing protein [Flavobacterium]
MKKTLLFALTIIAFSLNAQTTFTYTGIGNWTDQANWSPSYPGTTLGATDEIIITVGSEVKVSEYTINGKLINRGKLINSFLVVINGELSNEGEIESNSTFTNNGTVTNTGTFLSRSFFRNYSLFSNQNIFNSYSFFNNYATFNNEANFTSISFATNEGTLNNTGIFTIYSNFFNNAILYNDGTIINSSILSGNNTSHSNNFNLTANLSPAVSHNLKIGTYVFDADLFFENNAKLNIDINSTENDLVTVSDAATLNGQLNVTLLDGFDPIIGSEFTVLTASNITDTFTTLNFPDLGYDKEFVVIYNATSVVLKVVDSSTLGAEEFLTENLKLTIYPNPAIDNIIVKGITQSEKVTIYSILGIQVKQTTINQTNNSIDISNLNKGTYILSIGNKHQKFIKH